MEITEVRVFIKNGQDKKLKAYTTVTFDNCFVVRNIKVIQGSSGFFIAMPSRKMKVPCSKCHFRNETGSKFCSHCASKLPEQVISSVKTDESKSEHRDIAHPVTKEFREYLQNKVLDAYYQEVSKNETSTDKVDCIDMIDED